MLSNWFIVSSSFSLRVEDKIDDIKIRGIAMFMLIVLYKGVLEILLGDLVHIVEILEAVRGVYV
jgi:hypothetical protein